MTSRETDTGPVVVGDDGVTWSDYERVVYQDADVTLAGGETMARHRRELERQVADGAVIYAVNTGYGAESDQRIPSEAIERVQANTLRSHAVSVGDPVPEPIVRGMLLLKAQSYAQGPPALRPAIAERLVEMLRRGITPVVYHAGSQSASGDLIPNAHVGLASLLCEGDVWIDGRRVPAATAGLQPLPPRMKEGVALTNDVSFAAALAFDLVREAERLILRAEQVAAMTLQGLRGHPDAYHPRLVGARPHPGALETARHMRELLADSELVRDAGRPHDPYSLRCIPQVHGAVRDAVATVRSSVEIELRSVADNPLVFPDEPIALSGGNFHGAPLGIPLDGAAVALTTLAALSQRRTHHLVNPMFDVGLPAKLAASPSDQLGLIMVNTAAAALVSECAAAAAPASVTSIAIDPMEDHVSMAALAAQKGHQILRAARRAVACELLCAARALDFQGPARASSPTRAMHEQVRRLIPLVADDRPVSIEPLEALL